MLFFPFASTNLFMLMLNVGFVSSFSKIILLIEALFFNLPYMLCSPTYCKATLIINIIISILL